MVTDVDDLITRSLRKAAELFGPRAGRTHAVAPLEAGVPTLEAGRFLPPSPQLRQRYARFGRWEWATHGHWLGLDDQQALWLGADVPDPLLQRVRSTGIETDWLDSAPALFKPSRLSLFAASDLGYESVYLLWLESEAEPEVWVYDSNGESRYRDLAHYLQAYLDDDARASGRWRLAEVARE